MTKFSIIMFAVIISSGAGVFNKASAETISFSDKPDSALNAFNKLLKSNRSTLKLSYHEDQASVLAKDNLRNNQSQIDGGKVIQIVMEKETVSENNLKCTRTRRLVIAEASKICQEVCATIHNKKTVVNGEWDSSNVAIMGDFYLCEIGL